MNPTRHWESWRHKWCIHNTRTFLQNWHSSSAESGWDLPNKTCAAATAPSSCACCSARTRGLEFPSFLMPPTGSFICQCFPLWSGPGLPQVHRRHQVAPVSSRSKHRICWKTTHPKQRSKQKLIQFSTWKPCFDSLPGSGMTGASCAPCTPHNPKRPKHRRFMIRCVQAPENMKSEGSRFPGQAKPCFPLTWQSPTSDLGSFDGEGGCQPCLAPPVCPTSAPTGSRAAK